MAYDFAQTFFIDRTIVRGAPQVNISAIDLYFKQKPKRGDSANPNASGMLEPGVNVLFCETNMDGTPNILKVLERGRLEYNEIVASGDASSASRVIFPSEVYCDTDKVYAFVVQSDGHEDYVLWTNKKGYYYIGTSVISSGVNDKSVGNLYITQDRPTASSDPNLAGGQGSMNGTTGVNNSWISKSDEDLVFSVYVARYRNTSPVTSNTDQTSIISANTEILPHSTHEFILFDRKHSQRNQTTNKGEMIFRSGPYYSNNGNLLTVNVLKNSSTITSNNVDFTTVFPNANTENYIVLVSENADPAHYSQNYHKYNVRKVLSVQSNNTLIIEGVPSFTNAAAYFFVSPVGEVSFVDKSLSFNYSTWSPNSWFYGTRVRQDLLILQNSNANLTHRFVNNTIDAVTVTAAGSGYANTDYVVISSSTSGSSPAYANVRTNSSGNITSVFVTNTGYGLIASPTYVIRANSSTLSTGTGANLTFTEGPTLLSEVNKFKIKDFRVINYEVDAITPYVDINNPAGTSYSLKHQLSYYKAANGTYVVNQNAPQNQALLKNLQKNKLPYTNTSVILSRSNEVELLSNQSGNSTLIIIGGSSNNDFINTCVKDPTLFFHKSVINNDYSNEHTSFGNALAKHISSKIVFQNGKLAEDLLVFVRAYRPATTDIKVYARMYNSADPEAYDDKDWTLLTCIDGANQYSSPTDSNDVREYTFNIPQYPNTLFTSTGTVTISSGCTVITGISTNFTSELTGFRPNDLVKIYDPLFPDDHFITSVASVTNTTSMVLSDATSNNSLLGSGKLIDKIAYPYQVHRNIQNDNVARYFNSTMHAFDGFDTFSIKTVLLSPNSTTVPEVEDIRAIGVSA